jgi:hypothetical protein
VLIDIKWGDTKYRTKLRNADDSYARSIEVEMGGVLVGF